MATQKSTSGADALRERIERRAEEQAKGKRRQDTFFGEAVEIRALMTGARGRVMDIGFRRVKGEDGKETLAPIFAKYHPALLVESLYDPASGERLYSPGEEAAIAEMDTEEVDRVAKIAAEISGLDKASREEAKNDSGEAENGGSSSSSRNVSGGSSGR